MHIDMEQDAFEGPTVRLRQITPRDYEDLYRIGTAPEAGFRWRFRAATPSPEEFARSLWNSVLAQFAVTDHASDQPRGVVTGYSANMRDRWVFLATVVDSGMIGTGQGLEASALMIRYLFSNWEFRKIYVEVPEFNMAILKTAIERFMVREGTCKEHFYHGGSYWDVHTFSVTRARWEILSREDPLLCDRFRSASGDQTVGGEGREVDILDLDAFLKLLAARMEMSSIPVADSTLLDDAGLDSLAFLELADLVDELAGSPVAAFDWLEYSKSWTFRDLYLHFCTMSQTPRRRMPS